VIETVVRVTPEGVPYQDFLVVVQQRLELVIAQDGKIRDFFFADVQRACKLAMFSSGSRATPRSHE
jgi:hypothetical protein